VCDVADGALHFPHVFTIFVPGMDVEVKIEPAEPEPDASQQQKQPHTADPSAEPENTPDLDAVAEM
jgi:hypothetical protein